MVLSRPLISDNRPAASEQEGLYNMSLEVKDTNGEVTSVPSQVRSTPPRNAFVGPKRIVKVKETAKVGTLIDTFHVMSNPDAFRGIHCRLHEIGGRRSKPFFKLSSGFPAQRKGQTRCDLRLAHELDYEARSTFILQIVAENAWTDANVDTRNVAVHYLVVEVEDVPDSPPYFLVAPPVTILPETAKRGHTVTQVTAYDGDYANPRHLRYGLNPQGLPYSSYFEIHPDSGIISLRKDLSDLDKYPNTLPVILKVFVEELDESGRSQATSDVEMAIIIDDVINHAPKFLRDQ